MPGQYLPANSLATLVADVYTDGSYNLFGVQPSGYTEVSAGSTITLGPFDSEKYYNVENLSFSYVPYIVGSDTSSYQPLLSGESITAATVAVDDYILIQDKSNSKNLKTVSAQSVADLVVDSVAAAALQSDIDLKAPLASPTFTGTQTMPKPIVTKANGAEDSNAVTASGSAGVITTSALTTAAGDTYDITWTNTSIAATSVVLLSLQGGTNTRLIDLKVVPGAGSATLSIQNIDLVNALNGTVIIGYLVV